MLRVILERLRRRLVLGHLFSSGSRIRFSALVGSLRFQLSVAQEAILTQLALRHSLQDGAARLGDMGTVSKTTFRNQLLDIRKRLTQSLFQSEYLELSHSRSVEEQRSVVDLDKFATGSRMATLSVCPPNLGRSREIRVR
jgi:hypothetical protein